MEYYGGAMIIMGGKNCFAIASDLRFGLDHFTNGLSTPKIFKIHKKLFIGMTGLFGDIATVCQNIEYKTSIYSLKESRKIKALAFSKMVSNFLYQHRFSPYLVETMIGGLDDLNNAFIMSMDVIGATSFSSNFAVGGTCSETLYGICETFWKPDMSPEILFEVISRCFILGLNRDCLSGWGAIVHIVSKKGVISKILKTRMD
jgi:20S proteasome subunit beta 3